MIRVKNLTKGFDNRKGIYDLSLEVAPGEVFGLLGPRDAGKSTLIRILMGYVKPDNGKCSIDGKSCFLDAPVLHEIMGYLPENPSLPKDATPLQFWRSLARLRSVKSIEYAQVLAKHFEISDVVANRMNTLNPEEYQVVALISAFMFSTPYIILDEPVTGLGLLRQNLFIQLVLEEKRRGTAIFIASHSYSELERVCDRIAFLNRGLLIHQDDIAGIRREKERSYILTFGTEQEALRFVKEDFRVSNICGPQITVRLDGEMRPLIKTLGDYDVIGFEVEVQGLEYLFGHYFGGGSHA